MDVRGHAPAGIDPHLDVEDLAPVLVGRPPEVEPLPQYRVFDHVGGTDWHPDRFVGDGCNTSPMAGFPPGPRGIALVQGAGLSRDPLGWIERQRSRYGNVFSARFPYFGRVVYLAHPDAVKEAFTGSPALMHAGEANAGPLGAVLGTYSLLTLDDEPHMEQRKLLLPPFHGDNVRLYGEVMAEAAAREVETWSVGEQIQLREATQRITLEVILRAVFGVREEDRRREFARRILPLSGVSNMLIWMPFLRRVPFLARRVGTRDRSGRRADLRGDRRAPRRARRRGARRRALAAALGPP